MSRLIDIYFIVYTQPAECSVIDAVVTTVTIGSETSAPLPNHERPLPTSGGVGMCYASVSLVILAFSTINFFSLYFSLSSKAS